MEPYVVRQGDYLPKLAVQRGADADQVWNHAKNAELKQLRGNANMLLPGDVIHLPKQRLTGITDEEGKAEVELAGPGKIYFEDLANTQVM